MPRSATLQPGRRRSTRSATRFIGLPTCSPCSPVSAGQKSRTLEWDRVGDELHFPQTKSGREFWLPLVDAHHRILLSVRGLDPRWVFPSYGETGHIVSWDHKSVPGTLHSLRHTFATVGVEAGVPEEVMGRLLNHASKTITGQRYVKPKLDFLRSAMALVVEELERRLQGSQDA